MRVEKSMHSALRYFKTPWVSACVLASLTAFLSLVTYSSFHIQEIACIGFLVTFAVFCSVSAYQLVRQSPLLMFSPMPWFLLASGVYFGCGPLIYFFGNDMAKTYCHAVWPVDLDDLWQVTLLNALGVVLVFGVWLLQTREMLRGRFKLPGVDTMVATIFIFYLAGLPFRLLTIAEDCDLLPFTAPGFLRWFANLTSAGLVLLTAMALRKGGGWWFLWGAMLTLDVVGGILTFSKISILLAVVPCIFGYLLYRPKRQALWWIPVFLAIVYMASHSFVSFVRENVMDHNSIWGRMEMAQSFFETEQMSGFAEEDQAWWSRLNYANTQTFAMSDYDGGTPGDSHACYGLTSRSSSLAGSFTEGLPEEIPRPLASVFLPRPIGTAAGWLWCLLRVRLAGCSARSHWLSKPNRRLVIFGSCQSRCYGFGVDPVWMAGFIPKSWVPPCSRCSTSC